MEGLAWAVPDEREALQSMEWPSAPQPSGYQLHRSTLFMAIDEIENGALDAYLFASCEGEAAHATAANHGAPGVSCSANSASCSLLAYPQGASALGHQRAPMFSCPDFTCHGRTGLVALTRGTSTCQPVGTTATSHMGALQHAHDANNDEREALSDASDHAFHNAAFGMLAHLRAPGTCHAASPAHTTAPNALRTCASTPAPCPLDSIRLAAMSNPGASLDKGPSPIPAIRTVFPRQKITDADVRNLLRLPTEDARLKLGLSKNGFRLVAEAHGFKKWPQRQLVGLDNLMEQARNDKSLTAAGREERLVLIQKNIDEIMDARGTEVYSELRKISHVYHNRSHLARAFASGKAATGKVSKRKPTGSNTLQKAVDAAKGKAGQTSAAGTSSDSSSEDEDELLLLLRAANRDKAAAARDAGARGVDASVNVTVDANRGERGFVRTDSTISAMTA